MVLPNVRNDVRNSFNGRNGRRDLQPQPFAVSLRCLSCELIFHPNLEYLRTAAETPVLDDLRMVDAFVVLKTIQAAGVLRMSAGTPNPSMCINAQNRISDAKFFCVHPQKLQNKQT